jgi:hypothetical protein
MLLVRAAEPELHTHCPFVETGVVLDKSDALWHPNLSTRKGCSLARALDGRETSLQQACRRKLEVKPQTIINQYG